MNKDPNAAAGGGANESDSAALAKALVRAIDTAVHEPRTALNVALTGKALEARNRLAEIAEALAVR